MILEKRHLTSRGENRWISLHCKYDIDTHEFSSEDLAIYLIADEETDRVKHFVDNWGFEKEETFPRGLQHVLGNYNMTIKALDGFIA